MATEHHQCCYCGMDFDCKGPLRKDSHYCSCPHQEVGELGGGVRQLLLWCSIDCFEEDTQCDDDADDFDDDL
jgi:hypothetical protein